MLNFLGSELLFLTIFFGTTFLGVGLFDHLAKSHVQPARNTPLK